MYWRETSKDFAISASDFPSNKICLNNCCLFSVACGNKCFISSRKIISEKSTEEVFKF